MTEGIATASSGCPEENDPALTADSGVVGTTNGGLLFNLRWSCTQLGVFS